MKIQIYDEPWKHMIIDNFLDNKTFTVLQNKYDNYHNILKLKEHGQFKLKEKQSRSKTKAGHNRRRGYRDLYFDINWENIKVQDKCKSIFGNDERVSNCLKSVHKVWNKYYHQLNQGDDMSRFATKILFQMNQLKPYNKLGRNIHLDSASKIMTILLYVSENGVGTSLHNIDGSLNRRAEWKSNRLLVFVKQQQGDIRTYHSIQNDIPFYRDTINMTILANMKKLESAMESGEVSNHKDAGHGHFPIP